MSYHDREVLCLDETNPGDGCNTVIAMFVFAWAVVCLFIAGIVKLIMLILQAR